MSGNIQVCTKNAELRKILCPQPDSGYNSLDSGTSQFKWVDLNMGHIPADAVQGGYQGESMNDYIILAPYQEGIYVGKLTGIFCVCFILLCSVETRS